MSAVRVVLLVSTGATWEPPAVAALQGHPGTVLLKRCVDVADLLASASTGQADVAVLGVDLAGLDQDVLDELTRYGVRVVGVSANPDATLPRAARTAVVTVLDAARAGEVAGVVTALPVDPTVPASVSSGAEALTPSAARDDAAGRRVRPFRPRGRGLGSGRSARTDDGRERAGR